MAQLLNENIFALNLSFLMVSPRIESDTDLDPGTPVRERFHISKQEHSIPSPASIVSDLTKGL